MRRAKYFTNRELGTKIRRKLLYLKEMTNVTPNRLAAYRNGGQLFYSKLCNAASNQPATVVLLTVLAVYLQLGHSLDRNPLCDCSNLRLA